MFLVFLAELIWLQLATSSRKREPITLQESGFAKERDEGSWTQWLLDQIVVQSL